MNFEGLRSARVPLVLIVVMVGVLIGSFSYDPEARALPVLVAWVTIALLVIEVAVQAGTPVGRRIASFVEGQGTTAEPERVATTRALTFALGWPAFLLGLTILIGLLPAVLVYVFLSLKMVGGKSFPRALTAAVAVTAFAWVLFEWGMSYRLFRGVLMGDFGGF